MMSEETISMMGPGDFSDETPASSIVAAPAQGVCYFFSLILFTEDAELSATLRQRAAAYLAKPGFRDSGFDLEVFCAELDDENVWEGVLGTRMTTRVCAKVVSDQSPNRPYGYDLRLRSSVCSTYGWTLSNGVGTIDAGYCDPLQADLVCVRYSKNDESGLAPCSVAPRMHGRRVVQIVAPDVQAFNDVCVLGPTQKVTWLGILARHATAAGIGSGDRGGGFGTTGH